MLTEKTSRKFANGAVYLLYTEDNYPLEVTDTFLPYYTKDAIGRKQNKLDNYDIGDRHQRWMIGVSCMSGCPVHCKFCLLQGTKILLANGEYKNIEDIVVGDKVVASEHSVKQTPNSKDYATTYSKVTTVLNTFKRHVKEDIFKIVLKNGKVIECTGNHTIATKTSSKIEYIKASELQVGNNILTINRLNNNFQHKRLFEISPIETIVTTTMDVDVFNIETDEHNYVANDIVVHNCATGQLKKYRNLTGQEIFEQVKFILDKHINSWNPYNSKEFKINYTRMGEPFLNIDAVKQAIKLVDEYLPGIKVHHYISTIGISGSDFSWIKDNITLQVSLHSLDEDRRDDLIPYKKKMSIKELGQIRTSSNLKTTVNMTLVDTADFDITKLQAYFDPKYFFIKLSPINPNPISIKNNMGNGIIEGINLV